jgi:hypothetical protein
MQRVERLSRLRISVRERRVGDNPPYLEAGLERETVEDPP